MPAWGNCKDMLKLYILLVEIYLLSFIIKLPDI